MPEKKYIENTAFYTCSFCENTPRFFALKNNILYFIDYKKLYSVLSYLCIFSEFNEHFDSENVQNITSWLKKHKLLHKEFLSEISFHIAHNPF